MDARYTARKQELLQECQIAPEIFEQLMPRLETFMAPFVESFQRQEPSPHAHTYVNGLLSVLKPRDPSETLLYQVVAEHLETFVATLAADPTAKGLPDPVCQQGRLRIIAAIMERSVIQKILRHLKLAEDAPPIASARQAAFTWGF